MLSTSRETIDPEEEEEEDNIVDMTIGAPTGVTKQAIKRYRTYDGDTIRNFHKTFIRQYMKFIPAHTTSARFNEALRLSRQRLTETAGGMCYAREMERLFSRQHTLIALHDCLLNLSRKLSEPESLRKINGKNRIIYQQTIEDYLILAETHLPQNFL